MIHIFVGTSGSGKDTMGKALGLHKPISVTTRAIRPGEVDGANYHFVSEERFDELYATGALAEKTLYKGNNKQYGILKETLQAEIDAGRDIFLACDVNGLIKVREAFPDDVISFYVYADRDLCMKRMAERGDDPVEIADRYESWQDEFNASFPECEYLLLNDGTIPLEQNLAAIRYVVAQRRA